MIIKESLLLMISNEDYPSVGKKRFHFSSSISRTRLISKGHREKGTPVLPFHLKHCQPVKMKLHRSRLLTRPCMFVNGVRRKAVARFVVIKWNFLFATLVIEANAFVTRGIQSFFLFFFFLSIIGKSWNAKNERL